MKKNKEDRLKLTRFTNPSGTVSWRISGTFPDGSRVRRNYKTKSEGLVELAQLEDELAGMPERRKTQQTILTPEQLSDAEAAFQSVGSRQLSRLISHYLDLETRAKAKGEDLEKALAFFEGHYRAEIVEKSVLNAREEFTDSRVGLAPKTVEFYTSCTKHLLLPDPNKLLHTFTVRDVEKVLGRFSNLNSKRSTKRALAVFFNWAVRHHYCLENPCDRLDKVPQPATPIVLLSRREVKRLLQAAVEYKNGEMVPVIAIALFAGLRPSEIAALQPGDVNGERIRVSGGKMRRKLKRTVPLSPNLVKWLKVHPFMGVPRAMSYRMKVLKGATKAKDWVSDILRHTSISYQAERDRNEGMTAFNNGTSKEMMDRHYRDVIEDPREVGKFWSITPKSLAKAKIEVKLPGAIETDWPPKATLEKMVWERPMTHIAKDLGITDVALKKHCVKLGLKLPPMGYWLRQGR